MAFVTQLNPGAKIKRTAHPVREPIWEALWANEDEEESGYSAYSLHTLLREVLKIQESNDANTRRP